MFPAMHASDPISQRRHSHGRTSFGNIFDEAMAGGKIARRFTDRVADTGTRRVITLR